MSKEKQNKINKGEFLQTKYIPNAANAIDNVFFSKGGSADTKKTFQCLLFVVCFFGQRNVLSRVHRPVICVFSPNKRGDRGKNCHNKRPWFFMTQQRWQFQTLNVLSIYLYT